MPSRIEPETPDQSRSRRWARLRSSFSALSASSSSQACRNTRRTEACSESLHNVAGLVDLTALDCRGSSEGSADCFGQGLRAVDDEEPRHRRVEPALDEIVD